MSLWTTGFFPALLAQLASHPFETIRVSAMLDPEAPYNYAPLTDLASFERGLLPRILVVGIAQAARAFIAPRVRALTTALRSDNKEDNIHRTIGEQVVDAFWNLWPQLIILNASGVLVYPLHLIGTIASQPGLSRSMSYRAIVENIYRRHGIVGLWSGFLPKFISTTIYAAVSTLSTTFFLRRLQEYSQSKISNYQRAEQGEKLRSALRFNVILAAILGNELGSLLALPFDACSVELQAAAILNGSLPSTLTVSSFLLSKYGFRLFTISLLPQFVKHLAFSVVSAFFAFKRTA